MTTQIEATETGTCNMCNGEKLELCPSCEGMRFRYNKNGHIAGVCAHCVGFGEVPCKTCATKEG